MMNETKFDPKVFLSVPREIHVTTAAKTILDGIAEEEAVVRHTLVIALWHQHLASVTQEILSLGDQLADMDGGSFSRDYPDGLATMDMKLPGHARISIICTEHECERARMDIEDFINHMKGMIHRF